MPQPAHAIPGRSAATAQKESPAGLGLQDDASRQSFLRMVSHELRTPLNSIIGFSEILHREMCGPLGAAQYKEYAGLIGQSGHRLLKLVNQILDIVRLEGQGADLDLHPEPLAPLIADAFAQVREDAAAQAVVLLVDAADSLPEVMADARALQTVLVNLLSNAITASPAGAPIVVRARSVGRHVHIEVEDHGVGVDPADLDRIMRPFEQGEHALTRRSQGAGLGLPIVRLLCNAMNGGMTLRSALGDGLTATVALPAA